ncbi:efflux RND transporter periplasmic adaptor subunit [Pseudomonas sp. TTU2014-080ASC]|uniref:efflux RND transporter periplasmic adaptor subunit n=1 Tax=Pseudomonas sp. TTU2014-080ASC TaxID=1729724 RepID=UPI000718A104|nr:HlyD family secretion protein [Pseudomonas sp. TTU2014-080ASC]KRW62113.1 secretion protein HylD [Pseudomonas sp. TTU2014-080ASC]
MQSFIRVTVTLVVVAVALFAGHWIWQHYMYSPWTRDARIRADVVTIAPDVSGWVVELKVVDNQSVKKGDVLMTIDRDRYKAELEQAMALEQTRKDELRQREHQASRRQRLGVAAISAEQVDNAKLDMEVARGEFRQAQAAVKLAQLNLQRSEVRAPRSGHITNLRLAQGNYVNVGQPVMALVDESSFYIQGYFEETKLPQIREGMPVEIWLMGGDQKLSGHVESISRGITDRNSSPDGQLLADVEPTFNWVRLAQRIPVRIALDKVPQGVHLSAGMTASARILGEDEAEEVTLTGEVQKHLL